MFRRKIFPKRSWSVLATCESGRLCSSSTLSLFLRPMTASWLGTGSVGFSVPSMNPVRSRSWRYGQLEVSSASEATSESSAIAARDVEDHVVGAARQSENCVVLRGRHDEAVAAGNVLVEAGQVRRRVVRKRLAPGLSSAFPPKHRTRGTRVQLSRARRCRPAGYESRPCDSLRETANECKRRAFRPTREARPDQTGRWLGRSRS